jgi:error-prone DNA polymerase
MQIAMEVAGFTPAEADQLRQAMGSKRSHERMEALRQRLYDGMARNGVNGEVAEQIWDKLVAFASYGFPESHAVSFAYLVYASSWLKRYYPAAFCAALLNAQPMGFYSSHSLVQDARRHGVEIRLPDLNASGVGAILETEGAEGVEGAARLGPAEKGAPPGDWGRGGPAVRLGLGTVREVGTPLAERIVAERERGGPYTGPEDLVRRVEGIALRPLEALATAGTWSGFGLGRREALWVAGALAETGVDRLDGVVTGAVLGSGVPTLPFMTPAEEARADLWATGVSPEGHPTRFLRAELDELGVVPSERLPEIASGDRVVVAGVVTHRQRPATAGGTVFVNLEDEGGLINVVVSRGCWAHHRHVLQTSPALLVRGRLEAAEGVINVIALQVAPLPVDYSLPSRDFR